ncbi:MAG TPA: efflux RND transporter periplasmic adaptor subunit [Gammaproteobacteria bacterium]|nr:efflux RND transporter periplasmic adaptor subunit [Gammaproteobacteria bacterium]
MRLPHIVGLSLFSLVMLCAAQHAAAAELPFEVAEVRYHTLPREQSFDAVIEAVQQSTVAAQVTGRVVEINFDVGDLVPKDSVLVRIRGTEQRAGLEAQQAALREAEARYKEAQAEFGRVSTIYEKRLLPKAALDKASADLKAAQSRVEVARATLTQAGEQLGYTVITAPYSGVVLKRHVEIGETVSVGQPLMSGYSLETLRATASIPQQQITAVRGQQQARVILTQPDRTLESTRLIFTPNADTASHTYKVRAELPSNLEGVLPGMFAKMVFVTGEERRLAIPISAVARRSELTGVYVVDNQGKVALRQIRVGASLGADLIEVLSGLSEGETIALDPVRAVAYVKTPPGSKP